jgi:hypothetical protein
MDRVRRERERAEAAARIAKRNARQRNQELVLRNATTQYPHLYCFALNIPFGLVHFAMPAPILMLVPMLHTLVLLLGFGARAR